MLRDEHACWLVAPANAIPPVKEAVWRERRLPTLQAVQDEQEDTSEGAGGAEDETTHLGGDPTEIVDAARVRAHRRVETESEEKKTQHAQHDEKASPIQGGVV